MKITVKTVEYTVERRRTLVIKRGSREPNVCRACGTPMAASQESAGNYQAGKTSRPVELGMEEISCHE
jgi:hypothetical protein